MGLFELELELGLEFVWEVWLLGVRVRGGRKGRSKRRGEWNGVECNRFCRLACLCIEGLVRSLRVILLIIN